MSCSRAARPGVRRHRGPILLALTLAGLWLPAPVVAQVAPETGSADERPLELLLEHRESLALTSDQLSRLATIRERLVRANEPLVNRMMTLRREWQQQRAAGRRAARADNAAQLERIRSAAEPVRARIQQNNRTAMQAVNRLLNREQRTRLRGLVDERRRQDGAAATPRRGAGGRGND
jgi:hypothetical protein